MAQNQGCFPRRPTHFTWSRCLCSLIMLKRALISFPRPSVGSILTSQVCVNRCVPHRVGCDCGRPLSSVYVERTSSLLAYNCLEMLVVMLALRHFLPDLRGHYVLIRTDNMSMILYINYWCTISSCHHILLSSCGVPSRLSLWTLHLWKVLLSLWRFYW